MTIHLSSDNTVNALFMTPDPKSQRERELTEEEEYDLFRMEEENAIRAQEEVDEWYREQEAEADALYAQYDNDPSPYNGDYSEM